jgi:hypothetical protein
MIFESNINIRVLEYQLPPFEQFDKLLRLIQVLNLIILFKDLALLVAAMTSK